jgi:hypothetical protein
MSQEEATDGHVYFRPPTFWERFWPRLGFHRGRAPRPDEDELKEGWAPSWLIVETYVRLGWMDRLRVLLSGKLHVDHAIKTDVPIGRSSAVSGIGVLPPNAKRGVP